MKGNDLDIPAPPFPAWREEPVAVLLSGGLDSAILLADVARHSPAVFPIYIRFGLVWEKAEQRGLRKFLSALNFENVRPLKSFELCASSIYGNHWSTTGLGTPDAQSDDEAVFLPGRNLLLLSQAIVWCALQEIPTVALAPLAGNPFADSSDAFFDACQTVGQLSHDQAPTIVTPYKNLNKQQVMLRGKHLPLHLTFSCIHPVESMHCGECNKCAERMRAFETANLTDRTPYSVRPGQDEEPYVSCHA